MTVDELIQALQELNQPDLEVHVPCPHCCGQPGADFDLLDADHCLTMEREGRTVAVLGDPRHQSLRDRRDQSRMDVRQAMGNNPAGIARSLGLELVRRVETPDLEVLTRAKTDLPFNRTIFWRLVRADLLLEAREGEETHYVVVVSPYRASSEEIEELQQYDRLMAQLTGATTHRVVASVATDRRAREILEDGGPHWYQVLQEEVDHARQQQRERRAEQDRLWRERREQEDQRAQD